MKLRGVTMEKAVTLNAIMTSCRYFPLDTRDLERLYVDDREARGLDMKNRLALAFQYVPDVYQHVVYMGHFGSGKSTLMYQLEQQLQNDYRVIRYSVQEHLDSNNMTMIDLLYSLYEQLYSVYSHLGKFRKDLLDRIYSQWNSTVSFETESSVTASVGAEAGVELKLAGLFASIKNIIKTGNEERQTINTVVSKNISQYISLLNEFIAACESIDSKPCLVMIEDAEKLTNPENARDIFVNRCSYFQHINLRILITAPMYLKYIPEFTGVIQNIFTDVVLCPTLKVRTQSGEIFEPGVEVMQKIALMRLDESLIEKAALRKAILCSGGDLRDLLSILREAAVDCILHGDSQIDKQNVSYAFNILRSSYECIFKAEHLNQLVALYNNPRMTNGAAEWFMDYMKAGIILEYMDREGTRWCGIHPAVVCYLVEKGLITDETVAWVQELL